jgi:hypothetical protein
MQFQVKTAKRQPIKQSPLYGAEGQAVISNNKDGLRQDNVYPDLKIISGDEFHEKFGNTRQGWDKAVYSDNTLVNMVGKSYSVLSNQNFFGEIEKQLKANDINVMTRSINRDNRAFNVDHILSDDRYAVIIKNSKDEIRPMMSFTTSYDGSTKTQGHFGLFRKVCNNGAHIAQSEIGFSLKRRGDLEYVVIGEVEKLITKFMDNEFYEIKKKFEVLAEKPIVNLGEYVKMVCHETEIFKFEKSDENEAASKTAETVMGIIRNEARLLGESNSLWLGYNAFNQVLHNSKKGFQAAYNWDAKLFDFHMELAN